VNGLRQNDTDFAKGKKEFVTRLSSKWSGAVVGRKPARTTETEKAVDCEEESSTVFFATDLLSGSQSRVVRVA
jgi:hypothetical protein